EGEGDGDTVVTGVQFMPPFTPQTSLRLELPKDFKDASGRTLRNADGFPLAEATGPMPPLAKFAAAPFGVVERLAEADKGPALLPVTLRNVEADLRVRGRAPGAAPAPAGAASAASGAAATTAPAGKVSTLQP
ncbi:hypothetical protein K9U40_24450, partial [Xanthobacter autotrophicus]|uniref:hypothetical protein n=1 Tax=Xanthobacter autotrophicus TaxID=280 RepID=UPI0024ABC069